MNANEFLTVMTEDILETDCKIGMDTSLKDIEAWDSLAFVSFIAMANTTGQKKVTRLSVQKAETIGDLYALLG